MGVLQPLHQGYRDSLQRAQELAERDDDAGRRRTAAVMELFEDKFTLEGWERIGVSFQQHMALYGVGVQPVFRLALTDSARFRTFVQELEARIGETAPVAQIDGLEYWRFPAGGSDWAAILVAIVDEHLVVTLEIEHGEPLRRLFGLERPAASMVDAAELGQINRSYGFTPHGTSLVDLRRLVTALIGAGDEDDSILRRHGGEPVPVECRTELLAMAQQAPRLIMGYTVLDERRQEAVGVLELESSLAQALGSLAAPVPGLGSNRDGIEFGFSMRLDKLAEFVQARASAIRATPYACEWFQSMNDSAEQAGQQLAALYMGAAWFSGARVLIQDFELDEDGMPERVDAMAMLVAPNPTSLIAMARNFVPQLGSLDLVAGGPPQRLNADELDGSIPLDQPIWAAMSDSAIAVATGAGAETALPRHLAAAAPTPAPLFHMGYNGALYGKLMRAVEQATTEDHEEMPDGDDPNYVFQPLLYSVHRIYDGLDYVGSSFLISERGVELRTESRRR